MSVAAIFLIRTFIIFHDACHGSYLKKQKHNDLLGNVTGFLTFFPYRKWRREHLIHHAGSGNLEKRGIGDIWVMTVTEYKCASTTKRCLYKIYRNPFVMFVLGPFSWYLYLIDLTQRMQNWAKKKYLVEQYCPYHIIWQSYLLIRCRTIFRNFRTNGLYCWYDWHLVILYTTYL